MESNEVPDGAWHTSKVFSPCSLSSPSVAAVVLSLPFPAFFNRSTSRSVVALYSLSAASSSRQLSSVRGSCSPYF
jgi:hypothetical protein